MKKSFFGLIVMALLFVGSVKVVSANEGVFRLAGPSATSGRCFAASVYVDNTYRVLMTCRGLVVASDPVYNKYVVWTQVGERTQRVGEIDSGKMVSNVQDRFDNLFITLEADAFSSKPAGATVLSGRFEPIDFGTGLTVAPIITGQSVAVSPTTAINERGAVVPTVTKQDQNRLTAMVVGIGRAILFGFILLLIVVGVMSFLARRKNL